MPKYPKAQEKITCQCTNPFRHLARATPETTRKPFRGHGRLCRPRPQWPLQRSAARPRRHGPSQPRNPAPSGLGRRGCNAEGGAAATAVEKQSVAMGCFSGRLGKYFWIGHRYRRSAKLILFVSFSVRRGEKQEEQSSQICSCSMVLFKSYQQLHLTFAASSVACLETISWIPLDYPNADKPFSRVKKKDSLGPL